RRPPPKDEHAASHPPLDSTAALPLLRYFRDAPGGGDRLHFGRVVRLGSIEAIRRRALHGAGAASLPLYQVKKALARRACRRIFPKVELLHDYFRLVFRSDDARRPVF